MKSKIMPPTYFIILLLFSIGLHYFFPLKKVIHSPYSYIGIIFIIFGITLNLWTDTLFKKNKTTVKPYENPISLINSGPFSISRHPMYLGMGAILLGIIFILGSVITFVFLVLYIIIAEIFFIPFEEKNLPTKSLKR